MDTHFLDIKEKIELPSERSIHAMPSTAMVATLDAVLVIAQKSLSIEVPSMAEYMEMVDAGEHELNHISSAHHVLDTMNSLRIYIQIYIEYLHKHLTQNINRNIPF